MACGDIQLKNAKDMRLIKTSTIPEYFGMVLKGVDRKEQTSKLKDWIDQSASLDSIFSYMVGQYIFSYYNRQDMSDLSKLKYKDLNFDLSQIIKDEGTKITLQQAQQSPYYMKQLELFKEKITTEYLSSANEQNESELQDKELLFSEIAIDLDEDLSLFFGDSKQIIDKDRCNEFAKEINNYILYFRNRDAYGMVYSAEDLNKSLFTYRLKQFAIVEKYVADRLGEQFTKEEKVFDKNNRTFNFKYYQYILTSFRNLYKKQDSNKLIGEFNSDSKNKEFLQATYAYLNLCYFDKTISSQFKNILIAKGRNQELGLVENDTGKDQEIIIKYIRTQDHSHVKQAWQQGEFDSIEKTTSKESKILLAGVSIYDFAAPENNPVLLRNQLLITQVSQAFSHLKELLYKIGGQSTDENVQQMYINLLKANDNPNLYIKKVLDILFFNRKEVAKDLIEVSSTNEKLGSSLSVMDMNVLYSIYKYMVKDDPNNIRNVETNAIKHQQYGVGSRLNMVQDLIFHILQRTNATTYIATVYEDGQYVTKRILKSDSIRKKLFEKRKALEHKLQSMQKNNVDRYVEAYNIEILDKSSIKLDLGSGDNRKTFIIATNDLSSIGLASGSRNIVINSVLNPDTINILKGFIENNNKIPRQRLLLAQLERGYITEELHTIVKNLNNLSGISNETIQKIQNEFNSASLIQRQMNSGLGYNILSKLSEENSQYADLYNFIKLFEDVLEFDCSSEFGKQTLHQYANMQGTSLKPILSTLASFLYKVKLKQEFFNQKDTKDGIGTLFEYIQIKDPTLAEEGFTSKNSLRKLKVFNESSWLDEYYTANGIVTGDDYKSVTSDRTGNNISNYRPTSLANKFFEEMYAREQHVAEKGGPLTTNLCARRDTNFVTGIVNDTTLETVSTQKAFKDATAQEMLYHGIVDNFFGRFIASKVGERIVSILPTTYSDKITFNLFDCNVDKKLELGIFDEAKSLLEMNSDEYEKLFEYSVINYFKSQLDNAVSKFKKLYNLSQNSSISEVNDFIQNKTTGQLEEDIRQYNKNKYDNDRISIYLDRDYRVNGNRLSLNEISIFYSSSLFNLKDRFKLEKFRFIEMLLQNGVVFNCAYKNDVLYKIIHNKDFVKDYESFSENWIRNGRFVYAKGNIVKDDGSIESIEINNYVDFKKLKGSMLNFEVNPVLEKYYYIDVITSANIKYALTGNEISDPLKAGLNNKKDFNPNDDYFSDGSKKSSKDKRILKSINDSTLSYLQTHSLTEIGLKLQTNPGLFTQEQYNWILDKYKDLLYRCIATSEGSQYKRNVIIPATGDFLHPNEFYGVTKNTKVAIVKDPKSTVFNTRGDISKKENACDGGAFVLPLQAIFECGSLGENGGNFYFKKPIWYYYDPDSGTSGLMKFATHVICNSMSDIGSDANIDQWQILKQTMDIEFRSEDNIDLTKSEHTTGNFDFSRSILGFIKNPRKQLMYETELGDVYRIVDFKKINIPNSNEFIYLTREKLSYQDGKWVDTSNKIDDIPGSRHVAQLFDANHKLIRVRQEQNESLENFTKRVIQYASDNNLKTINSLFQLYQSLGGISSVQFNTNSGKFEINEDSLYATAAFCNNVTQVTQQYEKGLNQEFYRQPLKDYYIGYVTFTTGNKRDSGNINSLESLKNGSELNYVTLENRGWASQQDSTHETEEAELTEMSQVIASLDVGGRLHSIAKLAFEDLGKITMQQLGQHRNELIQYIKDINNDSLDSFQIQQRLMNIFQRAFIENYKEKKSYDLLNTIINLVKKDLNVDLSSGQKKFLLPISDPNVFRQIITQFVSQMNTIIKRKYPGIGDVMTPGYDRAMVYHFKTPDVDGDLYDSDLMFGDVLTIARAKLGKITIQDNTIIDPEGGANINIREFYESGIKLAEIKNGVLSIEEGISNLQIHNLLNSLNIGQSIIVSNKYNSNLKLAGFQKTQDGAYIKINQDIQEKRIGIVRAYLNDEQEKVDEFGNKIYYHSIDWFMPTDEVDVFDSNGYIASIDLWDIEVYDDFKDFLYIRKQEIKNKIIGKAKATAISRGLNALDDNIVNKILKEIINTKDQDILNSIFGRKLQINSSLLISLILKDDLQFRENIINPKNLRPQRIRFKTKEGIYYNIYDLYSTKELRSIKRGNVKFNTESSKKQRIKELIKSHDSDVKKLMENGIANISKDNFVEIDLESIENYAAEMLMTDINAEHFGMQASSLYNQSKISLPSYDKITGVPGCDLLLIGKQNQSEGGIYGLVVGDFNKNLDTDKTTIIRQKTTLVQTSKVQNGDKKAAFYDIHLVNPDNGSIEFKIGESVPQLSGKYHYDTINGQIITDDYGNVIIKDRENNIVSNPNLIVRDGIIYENIFFLNKVKREILETKSQKVTKMVNGEKILDENGNEQKVSIDIQKRKVYYYYQIDERAIEKMINAHSKNPNYYKNVYDYIKYAIPKLKEFKGFDSIQLNESVDLNNEDKIINILNSSKSAEINSYWNDVIDLTVNKYFKTYLYIGSNRTNSHYSVYKFGVKGDDKKLNTYGTLIKEARDRLKNFYINSREISRYVTAARIPAQSLQSYMQMKIIGFIPGKDNRVIASHYQTWLQGSDYDIDKAYIMNYSFDSNGNFIIWTPLFDYSNKLTVQESMKIPTPNQIKLIVGDEGIDISNHIDRINNIINSVGEHSTQYIKEISNLIQIIDNNSSNGNTYIVNNFNDPNNIIQRIQDHEDYYLPLDKKLLAFKNAVSSRIQTIVNDPQNHSAAYSPITMDDLHEISGKTPKGNLIYKMTSFNPAVKYLMTNQNMVGKAVIGISAIGEKVFMGLTYYFNEGIRSNDNIWQKRLMFTNTTSRIEGRYKNPLYPQQRTTTCITDVNWDIANLSEEQKNILKNKLLQVRTLIEKGVVKDRAALESYTEADLMISQLLSAATDNAKELILDKINAGKNLAGIYLHLLILGYDIKDIATFMTSPAVTIVASILNSNIYNKYYPEITVSDAIKIAREGYVNMLPQIRYNADEIDNEEYRVSNKQMFVYYLNKCIEQYNLQHKSNIAPVITEIEDPKDRRKKIKLSIHESLINHPNKYALSNAFFENFDLVFKGNFKNNQQVIDYFNISLNLADEITKIPIVEYKEDLLQLEELTKDSQETTQLGQLFGWNREIKPDLAQILQKYTSVQNFVNRQINRNKYIIMVNEQPKQITLKEWANMPDTTIYQYIDDIVGQIHQQKPWYDILIIKDILKSALELKILQEGFDFERFLTDEILDNVKYKETALDLYDLIKNQYNVLDIIDRSPQYKASFKAWDTALKDIKINSGKAMLVDQICKEMTKQGFQFNEKTVSGYIKYIEDLIIRKWIDTQNNLVFPVSKGDPLLTNSFKIEYYGKDDVINIKDSQSLASFKIWIEQSLFPSIKSGKLNILGTEYNIPRDNGFRQHISSKVDNNQPVVGFDILLEYIDQNKSILTQTHSLIQGLQEIDNIIKDSGFSITDLLMLYNIAILHNNPGNDRLSTYFTENLKSNSLLYSYLNFLAKFDRDMSKCKSEDYRQEALYNLGFNSRDCNQKTAALSSENTYKDYKYKKEHPIIIERQSNGSMQYKRFDNSKNLYVEYTPIFLSNIQQQDRDECIENFFNYNTLFLPFKDTSNYIGKGLISKNLKTVKDILLKLVKDSYIKIRKDC